MKRWSSWALVSLLAVLCCVVAVLQYRWIGEISAAERTRLREHLAAELNSLHNAFGDEIGAARAALQATGPEVDRLGREAAYSARYLRWKSNSRPLFRQIALAVPRNGTIDFESLDLASGQFASAPWPSGWTDLQDRLTARLEGWPVPPAASSDGVFEIPRFGHPGEGEQEWLLTALNLDYLRATVLTELLDRYLGESGRLRFDAAVWAKATAIFESSPGALARIAGKPDATVMLAF